MNKDDKQLKSVKRAFEKWHKTNLKILITGSKNGAKKHVYQSQS